jgi:hypothetical protein
VGGNDVRRRIALAAAEQIAEREDDAEQHGQQNEQAEQVPAFQHHFSGPALFRSHYFLPSAAADSLCLS